MAPSTAYLVKNGDLSLTDNDMAEEHDGKDQLRASAGIWLEELVGQLPLNLAVI